MRLQEIIEKLISREFTIDFNGHTGYYTKGDAFIKELQEDLTDHINCANGSNDGQWSSCSSDKDRTPEEVNEGMRKFYQSNLDSNIEKGDSLSSMKLIPSTQCSGCKNGRFFIFTGEGIKLDGIVNRNRTKDNPEFIIRQDGPCEFNTPEIFRGILSVDSNMVIANRFSAPDAPEGANWSLCHFGDRQKIAAYKLKEHNIAYGQMGNMSLEVFISSDRKEILLATDYLYDSEKDEETDNPNLKGYENIGSVSLGVWRYEVTTQNVLDDLGDERDWPVHRDKVTAEVPHGEWSFEHFYDLVDDISEEGGQGIYARLKLIEK